MQRGSGILLHLSSLPSPYGIGTMGKEAYTFVDFLENAGQKYWQILPLGPTSYGDSPYQSFSTFAGNPYFIDFDLLAEDGALKPEDYNTLSWGEVADTVDYARIFEQRFAVLKKAWNRDKTRLSTELTEFRTENAYWIENYAMYMALKFDFDQLSYQDWEVDIKLRNPEAMTAAYSRLSDEIGFWIYVQYRFFEQWNALKDYANDKGISIIGDIPIYVAEDSADAWAHNEILMLDENRVPIKVAGCPPDYFAAKGQLWGNPLYDWDTLKERNYEWWIARMRAALSMYDIVRIDHFRGFSAFYSIPYGREDAVIGEWMPGPGMDFFHILHRELGDDLPIIAEDLGLLDDGVRSLLKDTGFPGMKVVQFGLTPGQNSEYLPHNYPKNTVAYIGTHDNNTLHGWFEEEPEAVQDFALAYMRTESKQFHWGFMETMLGSPADTVVFMAQDLLGLDKTARMNTPSTLGGNWMWRLESMDCFTPAMAKRLKKLCEVYSR
ncbi:MAG: 4-alpha-glucanotransferase [Clostridia bacterium]|nr:4-alpha-glucanotransferase [Clostridia bacterium]